MSELNLQYQLANGSWMDCKKPDGRDRSDEFLGYCVGRKIKRDGPPIADTAEALKILESGASINFGSDWYSNLRIKPAPVVRPVDTRPLLRCKKCGQTGHDGAYPFSTLRGTSICDDCV